jgi:type III secretory pathway component EscS
MRWRGDEVKMLMLSLLVFLLFLFASTGWVRVAAVVGLICPAIVARRALRRRSSD